MTKTAARVYVTEFTDAELDAICDDEDRQDEAADLCEALANEIVAYGALTKHLVGKR